MLYSDKMKQILTKFGVDIATLPDGLYSTLLDAIGNTGGNAADTYAMLLNGTIEHYESEAITNIPEDHRAFDKGVKSVVLPNITTCGLYAFMSDTLETLTIGNPDIEFVSELGFMLSSVQTITFLHKKVTFGNEDFKGCDNLKYLIFQNAEKTVKGHKLPAGVTIVYPDRLDGYWEASGNWGDDVIYMKLSDYNKMIEGGE